MATRCPYCGSPAVEDRGEIAPSISDFECHACERRFYVKGHGATSDRPDGAA